MKLKVLVLAVTVGFSAAAVEQTNNPPPVSGAKIAFAATDFDFGKVDSGTPVKHEYIFTNIGNQVLEVTGVRPGCGCTTAGDWDKKVEPGKTGKIPVQFNSTGYGGDVHKTISVTCNDSNSPNVTLSLKGTIWKQINVSPSFAVFNLRPEGQSNQTQIIKIVNNSDQPVTVSDPACGNPAFQMELKTVQEGKEFELHVTAIISNISGNVSSQITLKTSSTKMPQVSVTAYVMMQPLLAVNPAQIQLSAGPLPKATQMSVMIQNNGTNPVVLTEPKVNADGVDVKLDEIAAGRQYNLTVNFPAGYQSKPGIQATIKSSSSKYPLITIPVNQPQPPPPTTPAATPAATSPSHSGSALAQPAPAVTVPMALKK